MGTFTDRLNIPDYKSWLKSGLILKHLKYGLEEYLENESLSMHQSFLSAIQQGLPPGTSPTCTKCNNTFAKSRHWLCRTHKICSDLRDKLDSKHVRGKGNLVLSNSDVSLWTNPAKSWEIAKCFMSAGYKTKYSAHETDCTGLLGLIINCKTIRDKFSPALIQPTNAFEQVREIRNNVMHSPDLTSSTNDVNYLVQKALDILKDPPTLLSKTAAIDAANKIKEIHTVEISITREDEMQVLIDAVKALELGQAEHEEKLKVLLEEHKTVVGDEIKIQCHDIEKKTKSQIDDVKATLEEKENKIKQIEGLLDLEQIHIKQVDTILKSVNTVIESNMEATRDIRTNMEVVINNNRKLHELISGNRQCVDKEIRDMKANQENSLETLSQLHSDQTNTKQRVADLESRQNETQTKMEEFGQIVTEAAATNTVRQNIIANTKAHIETHARNECYTNTSAVQTVLDKLSEKHVVVITGKAGVGKTTAILEVMSRISDGYLTSKSMDMAIIDEAGNWDTVVNCNDKMLVFLDDPFGRTNVDQNSYDKWEKKLNQVFSCVEKGNLYVILGIRLNIFDELRDSVRKYTLFDDKNVTNLSAPEYELSEKEKTTMVQKYMHLYGRDISCHDQNEIVSTNPYYGFPQTCFLFFKESALFNLGVSFFKLPDASLRNEIEHLRTSSNNIKKLQYCVLVYTLLYKTISVPTIDMVKMNDICKHIEMKDITARDIEEAITSLSGNYLIEESQGVYEFKHMTILEAVFLSFGKLAPKVLIQNCSAHVLHELIKPETYLFKENEIVLRIRRSDLQVLVERLVSVDPTSYTDDREVLLTLVENVCSNLTFQETMSALSCPSKTLKFFIACRFGQTHLVKQMLTREKPAIIAKLKELLFSKPETILSRKVIIHGLYQTVVQGHLSSVKAILKFDRTLSECSYSEQHKFVPMIHIAASRNQLLIMNYLCSFNSDVIRATGTKTSLLHYCVVNGLYDVLEALLKNDPLLVNLKDTDGYFAICYAGAMGQKSIITLMYKYKADINCYDRWGKTPLHYCAAYEWYDVLETILKEDSRLVNIRDINGDPLICWVARKKYKAMFMFLYKHKSNVSEYDSNGQTVLHYCVDNDWFDVLEILFKEDSGLVNIRDTSGDPLICRTARKRFKAMFLFLYEHKANINTCDIYGKTALHYCMENDWFDVLETLLKTDSGLDALGEETSPYVRYRLDIDSYDRLYIDSYDQLEIDQMLKTDYKLVNITDTNGDPPICWAARKKDKVMFMIFYKHKANVKTYDSNGKTALHYCVENDWCDVLETMFTDDSRLVNTIDSNGDPLICWVARKKYKAMFMFLYKHKANVSEYDSNGQTVLHYCVYNDWCDVLETLFTDDSRLVNTIDSNGDPLICWVARKKDKAMFMFLYKHKANVSEYDSNGQTVLHYCVYNDWCDVLETLFTDDSRLVNTIDSNGEPLIFWVARKKDKAMFMFLYKHKANVSEYDPNGQTVLHYCVDNDWGDVLEILFKEDSRLVNIRDTSGDPLICWVARKNLKNIFIVLYEHRADLSVSDSNGQTVLHHCFKNDWFDVLETLLKADCGLRALGGKTSPHVRYWLDIDNYDKLEIDQMLKNDSAFVNIRDTNGDPPIVWAARKKDKVMFMFFYIHKADVNACDSNGKTALNYCVDNDWCDVLETCFKDNSSRVNVKDDSENPLICYAAKMKRKAMLMLLCKHGANTHVFDRQGKTVLHYCVDNDWYDVLSCRIQNNPQLLVTSDEVSQDPLVFYAARKNRYQIFKILYGHKQCNVKRLDSFGKTLLHYCVDNDWYDILRTMLKNESSLVNIQDTFGDPLVCCAARKKHKDMLIFLFKHKANAHVRDSHGKTVLHYCVDNDWCDVLGSVIKDDPTLVSTSDKEGGESLMCYAARQKYTTHCYDVIHDSNLR